MCAAKNFDAVANQHVLFNPHVPDPEPLAKGGHKPGVKASPADHVPEFHAKTLPPGSAPPSSTYTPNPDLNGQGIHVEASETITGATSADVHDHLGHPGAGMSSQELHDNRRPPNSNYVGLKPVSVKNDKVTGKDPLFAHQRNLGDVPAGQRGGQPAAEERYPE
ncbi:hypothetical protein DM02DRAFT_495141, partial [Periconia macrospinosa]